METSANYQDNLPGTKNSLNVYILLSEFLPLEKFNFKS